MIGDKAVRVGEQIPTDYQKMVRSECSECRAIFSIIHQKPFADAKRANSQIDTVRSMLGDEHVDDNFKDHLKSYDLDD
jgi:hypothetical protein